jgi:glycosyltransferase involved in cell wall biosynthesis
MADRPLAGLHIVLIPTWFPTPERPTGGRIFQEYVEAFIGAGARVGVLYPDLLDLRNFFVHRREPGYGDRVRQMSLPASLRPVLTEETMAHAPVVRVRGLHTSLGKKERRTDTYAAWLSRAYDFYAARHGAPDIFHAHCAVPAGWAALRLAERLQPRPRVVLTEHTGPFKLLLPTPAVAERTLAACREADAIAAVGGHLVKEMHEAGVTRPIKVIPNPVAAPYRYTPPPPVGRTREDKPLFRALYAGRFSREKGIPEFAQAIERIAREPDLEVHWDFYGFADAEQKEEEERLRRVFAEGSAKGMGVLHGMQPREVVAPATRACHFIVLPSHRDNCPLAVMEARAVGRPTVGTRGSGVESYVGPGDGLLCRIGDAEDLSRAVLELLRPYERWDARAIAGRAMLEFGPEAIAGAYAALFRAGAPSATPT